MEQTLEHDKGTGAIDSPIDYRTVNVEYLAGATPADLSAYPREGHVPHKDKVPFLNQKKIGACTNYTAAEMMMHRHYRLNGAAATQVPPIVTPRFSYTLCKIEDGLADKTQQGTYVVQPFKVGVKYGFANNDTCQNNADLSFDDYIFHRQIAAIGTAAFTEADLNRIPGYAQVGKNGNVSVPQVLQAFNAQPDGIKFCIPIGNEFWTDKNGVSTYDRAKLLPIRPMTHYVSGHDMWMTDYELEAGTDRLKVFFRNHWSDQWCSTGGFAHDGGDGWFYYDEHPFSEAWVISEIPDKLMAIIKALPAQKDFNHKWSTNLDPGASGADVEALQIALKIVGTFPFNQPVTQYFGNITKAAVMSFQLTYNVTTPQEIASAGGKVGPKTRDALNKIFSHQ